MTLESPLTLEPGWRERYLSIGDLRIGWSRYSRDRLKLMALNGEIKAAFWVDGCPWFSRDIKDLGPLIDRLNSEIL